MHSRWVTISSNPFEFLVSIAAVVYGVTTLALMSPTTGAVGDALSPVINIAWGASLTFGGLLVLTGMMVEVIRIRLAGNILLGTTVTIYGLILLFAFGVDETLSPIAITSLGLGFALQAYSLRKIVMGSRMIDLPNDDQI